MEKKLIPLPTKHEYYCREDGAIFRKMADGTFRELSGSEHQSYTAGIGYHDKYYRRFVLAMKDGTEKKFYGQRLTALAWHDLQPGQIVRHLTSDTMNNHKDAIACGTQMENQGVDRIEQGTYWNRGGGKAS